MKRLVLMLLLCCACDDREALVRECEFQCAHVCMPEDEECHEACYRYCAEAE